jgi:hypothetical protein
MPKWGSAPASRENECGAEPKPRAQELGESAAGLVTMMPRSIRGK